MRLDRQSMTPASSPTTNRLGNPWGAILAVVYLVAVSALFYVSFSHWSYDDPHITYRYAQNLARGVGLVYNPGERVLSTTTPLYAILLGGLSLVWSDIPELANLISAISVAAGALMIWSLANTWQTPEAGWAGLLLYPSFSLLILTISSETPLYLFLCTAVFAAYAKERLTLAALCAALAVLTRPDAILVPVILGFHHVWARKGKVEWKAALIFAVIALPWLIFAFAYYGSPIPVTLAAKQAQAELTESTSFAPGVLTIASWYWDIRLYRLEGVLAFIGLVVAFARERRWLLFMAWPALYFAAYSALGVSAYHWYYTPLVPGLAAAVGLGLSLPRQILSMLTREAHPAKTLIVSIPAAMLLILLTGQHVGDLLDLRHRPDPRARIYQAAGEWLQANTPESASVASLEVGIIGYYAQRRMVDFAGLIQPEIATKFSSKFGYEEAATYAFDQYSPDYVVLPDDIFPDFKNESVSPACSPVKTFTASEYGANWDLHIYRCS